MQPGTLQCKRAPPGVEGIRTTVPSTATYRKTDSFSGRSDRVSTNSRGISTLYVVVLRNLFNHSAVRSRPASVDSSQLEPAWRLSSGSHSACTPLDTSFGSGV